jgi:2-oxoisovalerate dehydrogenase E1 component
MGFPSRRIFEKALLSRFTEEAFLELFSQGELFGTVHTCIGQELSGAIISEFLTPNDTITSNHRCHGHFLSHTNDLDGLVGELMGKESGVCGGIGGSQHLCKDGFFSNGIQGGIAPLAAGLALGHKITGNSNISVLFIGDGTLGEGVLYETLNIASKWSLPLLIVLEDNKYSQSTAQEETLAGSITMRAEAFGIEVAKADTWNYQGFFEVAKNLISDMRINRAPKFLHLETFRLKAHSKGDDIRPPELIKSFEEKDPVNIFLSSISSEDLIWVNDIRSRVEDAINNAKTVDFAKLQLEQKVSASEFEWVPISTASPKRYIQALNEAFIRVMGDHNDLIMLGEDIRSPYGGAFKATKNLSDLYPERVLNTPISEACIVGISGGLGLMGFTPVVEIMFGDFLGLAFDQILNHITKFNQMYKEQVSCNVIIRTPMGGGRGYGPTHSQTLDKHFIGIPDLKVVALNDFVNPSDIYTSLIEEKLGPALVIENKKMYGGYYNPPFPKGFSGYLSTGTFPDVFISPNADQVDLTIIAYGGMSQLVVEACDRLFEHHDLIAQGLLISQIYPFQIEPYLNILARTNKIIIIEEGQKFGSFGSEVLSQLMEKNLHIPFLVKRVSSEAYCIPTASPLEAQILPSLDKIIAAALSLELI